MAKDVYDRRAKDVMSRDLVTIDAKDSVHDALQLMAENKVATLPVVDRQSRCIGILSTSDFVEVTRDMDAGLTELENADQPLWGAYLERLGDNIGHQGVTELMSESVVSIGPDAPLFEVASRMLREHVHRLPVVGSNDRLLGIISMTDILAAFVECAPLKTA
jgi:CBS-domain-containing membrane protein